MSKAKYRIESDSLGEVKVPYTAYYGAQTQRAKENFPITGFRIDKVLIQALGIVKKAAAMANCDIGLLDKTLAEAIVLACDEVIDQKHNKQFVVDPIQGGAGTSINMNANEVIANLALEKLGYEKGEYDVLSPNTHVNMSQSTNDAFPTAVRIALLHWCDTLLISYEALHATFLKKAEEFSDIIKMGRTHLQDAVPIRLGQEFSAYAAVIGRDIKRIQACRDIFAEVNMGATAVGTGLNADNTFITKTVGYLSELSGFKIVQVNNMVDGTQNTDAYTSLSANLRIGMLNLSKIANDLRLMASGPKAGLYEIQLPARQPGSSIMPGKVNPVIPEVINQIAFQVMGNDHTVSMASEAGQFELNVMEPVLFFNLLQSLKIMANGLHVFNHHCVAGIQANTQIMNRYVERSIGIITAINPHIGYEMAAKIAKESLRTGTPVRQLCLEHNLLSPEELDVILDPWEMTNIGISGYSLLHKKQEERLEASHERV